METHSLDEISNAAIKGQGSLTNKLITANRDLDPRNPNARRPKDMSEAEKHEFVKSTAPGLQ